MAIVTAQLSKFIPTRKGMVRRYGRERTSLKGFAFDAKIRQGGEPLSLHVEVHVDGEIRVELHRWSSEEMAWGYYPQYSYVLPAPPEPV